MEAYVGHHAAVLLMCGGLGTRMRPWSERRHKCLVGTEDVTLFRGHLKNLARHRVPVYAKVPHAWLKEFKAEAAAAGTPVHWIAETGEPDGSGAKLLQLARRHPRTNWWVIYGDTWFSPTWYAKMAMHAQASCNEVVVAAEAPPKRREDWRGILVLRRSREGNRMVISSIDERPTRAYKPDEAAFHAGMSIFRPGPLRVALGARASWSSRRDLDLFGDVLPYMLAHDVSAAPIRLDAPPGRESADVGTPIRYAEHVLRRYHALFGLAAPDGAAAAALAVLQGRRIYVCGNGGACCVAAHAALDWGKAGHACVEALSDAPAITAWANDHRFETAFASLLSRRQIAPGDVVVLMSASGKSPNVLEAAKVAAERGADVVAVTAAGGTPLRDLATHAVALPYAAPSRTWGYGPLEDAMSAWMHAVTCVMEGLSPLPGR